MKFSDYIKEHAISEEQISKFIAKGLLASGIRELIRQKDVSTGYYVTNKVFEFGCVAEERKGYLKSFGILYSFVSDGSNYQKESFFITDFFLIYFVPNEDWKFENKNGKRVCLYKGPDKIIVVPLESIEKIEKNVAGKSVVHIDEVTKTVDKNPIAGAAVGAVVAGPTGAVVGAIANSGTKTKVIQQSSTNRYIDLIFRIKLQGCKAEYEMMAGSVLANRDEQEFYEYLQKDCKEVNSHIMELIHRAKSNLSENEKVTIVKKTCNEGEKEYSKAKTGERVALVVVIAVIFLICLLISSC